MRAALWVVRVMVFVLIAFPVHGQIDLSVTPQGVQACGFESDARVVLWGVEWEALEWAPRLKVLALETKADETECAVWEGSVPWTAVWVAADTASGDAAAASRSDFDPQMRLEETGWEALQKIPGEDREGLLVRGRQVAVLLVRPSGGAWFGLFSDGGKFDGDAMRDGWVLVDPHALQRVKGSRVKTRPKEFRQGDMVVSTPVRGLSPTRLVVPAEGGAQ